MDRLNKKAMESNIGMAQAIKKQTRFTYTDGPMTFLAQQIARGMQDSGWDPKIHSVFRSPEQQEKEFKEGDSKARAFSSPHQYYEGADIVHRTLFWNAPQRFWDDLYASTKVVEAKYKVRLVKGYDWGWDLAHVEIENWRTFRLRIGRRVPTSAELDERFKEVLPSVWAQYVKSVSFQTRP